VTDRERKGITGSIDPGRERPSDALISWRNVSLQGKEPHQYIKKGYETKPMAA